MSIPSRTIGLHSWTTEARVVVERLNGRPAWVVLTELFIGLGWLRAAAEKIIDPLWWRGEGIEDFVASHAEATLGWYEPFLGSVVLPLAPVVAVVVIVAQLVAGVSLVTGRRLAIGLTVGMFLNLHFMAAGAVTPSAFYLLGQGALALWLCEWTMSRTRARALRVAAAVGVFVVGLNVPFISTLHPAGVIDDPAVMFSFAGALAAVTCLLAASADTTSPTVLAATRPSRPLRPPR